MFRGASVASTASVMLVWASAEAAVTKNSRMAIEQIRISSMRPIESSTLCLVLILVAGVVGHGSSRIDTDVLHYAATLEPDISAKSVKGSVQIRVSASTAVDFNCGDLIIDSVTESGAPLQFSVSDH